MIKMKARAGKMGRWAGGFRRDGCQGEEPRETERRVLSDVTDEEPLTLTRLHCSDGKRKLDEDS